MKERRASPELSLGFRENLFSSFFFFLLSGKNRIIKESGSRKLADLECEPFSQNSLAFNALVWRSHPLQSAWGLGDKEGKCLTFESSGLLGSCFPNCVQNELGVGLVRGKKT